MLIHRNMLILANFKIQLFEIFSVRLLYFTLFTETPNTFWLAGLLSMLTKHASKHENNGVNKLVM